ncbi:peptidyl-prolyl cis-trans isomerase CYP63-like [Populus alba x Populus x berolinensis]|uniref:Peptidyl-prolyl cis-trans isomerase CYP63-like n=1 Tax=Populus alba x Populus x berolinensis TaxID=444605 RepID=A0AAD6MAR4_9ROSI|nr:peptidyl-prolyl cis-trans isomerase CYP63-like [Populus alba x Populus x berolinensis]KAJ6981630.1 peptidyl-prolyl cis-trans isomerase CYP63-like [Populus alba x Populus x berolinensis]
MGLGKHTGKPMCLKGSTFYNIVRGKWAEGEDFSEENGKSRARSSDPFSYAAISKASATMMISGTDEGERLKHDAPCLLTTASDYHKYTIDPVSLSPSMSYMNSMGMVKHVVFGRVVRGYETVQRPEHLVIITACGVSPKTRSLNSILIRKGLVQSREVIPSTHLGGVTGAIQETGQAINGILSS